MQVVILCGGQGKNLMPMTEFRPLGLLRIAGKTLIEYQLDQLKEAGFDEVTLAIGHSGDMYASEFESGYKDIKIDFTRICQNGTANALLNAYKNDDMIVIEANCIFNFDLKNFLNFHIDNKNLCTFASKKAENYSGTAYFSINRNNEILTITKNPLEDFSDYTVSTGVYIISKSVFESYSFEDGKGFMTDILPQIITSGNKIMSYNENGYWQKLSSTSDFLKCQKDILNGKTNLSINAKNIIGQIYSDTDSNFNGVSIIPPVYIGKNATIKAGSIIGPNTVIDDNSFINSRIRADNSYIGQNVIIKSKSEINSAIICNGSIIGNSVICSKNSVIGEKVNICGNSIITENMRVSNNMTTTQNTGENKNKTIRTISIDDECECNFGKESNLTASFAEFGMAIGTAIDKGDTVIVGHSGSHSSEALTNSLISGLLSTGVKVYNLGNITCQQMMFLTNKLSSKLGCFISADYSAKAKLMDCCGLPITHGLETVIENAYNKKDFRVLQCSDYESSYEFSGAGQLYIDYLRKILQGKLSGVNADIRCSSTQIAKISDNVIYPKNDVDGEHLIFHISPDGSSCSVYTEKTNYIFHERLILLAIKICCEKNIPVSIPFTFPSEAENITQSENGKLYRYYNCTDGSDDSIARTTAMRLDNLFVRDGLMLACIICKYLSENGFTLEEAMENIPKFCSVQRYISVSENPTRILDIFAIDRAGYNEGTAYNNGKSRAIIRPLKNRRGIMVFAESYKAETAAAICDEIQIKLKKYEDKMKK